MDRMALEGVRITDFCWVWAGPAGTELLAFLGAEVIKVESESRLDVARRQGLRPGTPFISVNQCCRFNSLNLNKRSITVDLAQPKGIQLVKDLIAISDVVTHNFSAGAMARLGLDYAELIKVKPDIIMVAMSGFGDFGPMSKYRGYAPQFAALSGFYDLTGYEDRPPGDIGVVGHLDLTNGTALAFATLAALEYWARTGKGQFVDISQWEVSNCIVGDAFMDHFINRRSPTRMGNRDEFMAPHNCYRCRGEDKWVSIAVATDEEWQALCQAIGKPEWTKDERFADAYNRRQNRQELDRLITEWTINHTHFEVTEILQREGVAAFPSMNQAELAQDPHLRERGAFLEVEHPEDGKNRFVSPPWKLSATPARITRHAPLLGQDNEYVFGELLGLTPEQFSTLVEENVIYH